MKRAITISIQALVTGALVWWILHDPEKRSMMAEAVRTANWWWMLPLVAASGIAIVLQTLRWQILLRVQDIHPGFWRTQCLNMIGLFFNLFLPGSTGGDILKIYYTIREAPQKKMSALLSVVLDRVMGLLALIAIALVISLMAFPTLWGNPTTRPLLMGLFLICGASLSVIGAGIVVEIFGLASKIPKWVPLRGAITELAAAFSTYARRLPSLAAAFLISLPVHLLLFSTFYFASRAFSVELGWTQLLIVLPIVLTIAALPISLAGLGVREELFQVTLGALYGTTRGLGALIGFAGFLGVAFWALLGGIVYILYRPTEHHPIRNARREVEDLEQKLDPPA
jgi:uncharacterized protein (TIRG00374 family)